MSGKRPMTAGQMRAAAGVPSVQLSVNATGATPIERDRRVVAPFDPKAESVFCARCGTKLEPLGHLMARFLLCPTHGEFTIAPVVIEGRDTETFVSTGKWEIHFDDEQAQTMWETCRGIDARGLSGRATRTG